MYTMKTEQKPGVAVLTISVAQDDHQFEVWVNEDTALVEYQETCSWRGQIRVSEPDEDIFKELVLSDEMTEFLDEHDCQSVKRAEPKP